MVNNVQFIFAVLVKRGSVYGPIAFLLAIVPVLYGCGTGSIEKVDLVKEYRVITQNSESAEWLENKSDAFENAYEDKSAWKSHRIGMLGYSFLARDGAKQFLELPPEQQKELTGVQTFMSQCHQNGGAVRYLAVLAARGKKKPLYESDIESTLNPLAFQDICLADYLRYELTGDEPDLARPHEEQQNNRENENSPENKPDTPEDEIKLLTKGLNSLISAQLYYRATFGIDNHPDWFVRRIHRGLEQTLDYWKNILSRLQKVETNRKVSSGTSSKEITWPLINERNRKTFFTVLDLVESKLKNSSSKPNSKDNQKSSKTPTKKKKEEKKMEEDKEKEKNIPASPDDISVPFPELTDQQSVDVMSRVREFARHGVENWAEDRKEPALRNYVKAMAYIQLKHLLDTILSKNKKNSSEFHETNIKEAIIQILNS